MKGRGVVIQIVQLWYEDFGYTNFLSNVKEILNVLWWGESPVWGHSNLPSLAMGLSEGRGWFYEFSWLYVKETQW